jgi:hypothetical protein
MKKQKKKHGGPKYLKAQLMHSKRKQNEAEF